jgi:phenylpyruvate tautomerase PptA (4-oxalocrotonate tautomerase family)
MPQVKITGLSDRLPVYQAQLVQAIDAAFAEVTGLAADKIIYRCYPLAAENFRCSGRSPHYTIVEISMFAGRSIDIKKQLIQAIFAKALPELGWEPNDLEIILVEIPNYQWGLRGMTGDEL